MQAPRQHRLAGAAAAGNHHAAQARIHRGQQQGQLQRAVAGDGGQGEGTGRGTGACTGSCSACNHGVIGALRRARQSR